MVKKEIHMQKGTRGITINLEYYQQERMQGVCFFGLNTPFTYQHCYSSRHILSRRNHDRFTTYNFAFATIQKRVFL
jgi:hypothetical protein